MKKYLSKWLFASLLMPALVMIFKQKINTMLILMFWPSSIVLMSLGAEEKPLSDVVYVWSASIGFNIILYLLIGYIFYKLSAPKENDQM